MGAGEGWQALLPYQGLVDGGGDVGSGGNPVRVELTEYRSIDDQLELGGLGYCRQGIAG